MMTRADRRPALALVAILLVAASLRIPRLDRLPDGLIPDEAAGAYDAYSILKTGRDQYGELLPLFPRSTARLHAFYMFLVLPSVGLAGLEPWAVRLPAALVGLVTVILAFLLVRDQYGPWTGVLTAGLLAVSPWHVLISRTGHDWVVLPMVLTLTVVLLLRALRRGSSWWLAGVSAGACLYTYTPIRLILPTVLLGVLLLFGRGLWEQRWRVAPGILAAALVAWPVVGSVFLEGGMNRLSVVRHQAGTTADLVRSCLDHYVASFSPGFLFYGTDAPALHRLRSTGLLYAFEAPLVVLGIIRVLRGREPAGLLILYWFVAAPFTVSIHKDSPDPILAVTSLPSLQALGAIGGEWLVQAVWRWRRGRWPALLAAAALVVVSVLVMARDLYMQFPVYSAPVWTQGVRETVQETESLRGGFDDVLVDGRHKLIAPLILFYARYDPVARQREAALMTGRADRTRVGPYRIGSLEEGLVRPGRHLVWTTRAEGRRLFPGLLPLRVIPWPDGRNNHTLFAVTTWAE